MSQERSASFIEAVQRDEATAEGSDTEGHSMLTYEPGSTLEGERRRQAEQASKRAAWTAAREHRLVDRLSDGWAAWRAGLCAWARTEVRYQAG